MSKIIGILKRAIGFAKTQIGASENSVCMAFRALHLSPATFRIPRGRHHTRHDPAHTHRSLARSTFVNLSEPKDERLVYRHDIEINSASLVNLTYVFQI